MRFVLLAIVLTFPVIDLLATVRFARWTGVPLWMWLGLSTVAGFVLLRNQRLAFRSATAAAMHGQQLALRGLFDSGRKVLAGFLFLLPGIVSDLMALLLLGRSPPRGIAAGAPTRSTASTSESTDGATRAATARPTASLHRFDV
jgi:UPF0716 protein FxsA